MRPFASACCRKVGGDQVQRKASPRAEKQDPQQWPMAAQQQPSGQQRQRGKVGTEAFRRGGDQAERAEIGATGTFASRAGEAWYTGTALNVTEGGNTATTVMPGYTVANIPAGFTVKPIATGCFVMVFAQRRTDGTIQWVFWCENAIDGSC